METILRKTTNPQGKSIKMVNLKAKGEHERVYVNEIS